MHGGRPGVVHQAVDPAVPVERRRGDPLGGALVEQVRGDGQAAVAGRGDPGGVPGGADHRGPLGGEQPRDRRTDSGGRPGDDDDLVLEPQIHDHSTLNGIEVPLVLETLARLEL
ncbi:hypothetical protein GCM10009605_18530 [Nocardiopsis composta]